MKTNKKKNGNNKKRWCVSSYYWKWAASLLFVLLLNCYLKDNVGIWMITRTTTDMDSSWMQACNHTNNVKEDSNQHASNNDQNDGRRPQQQQQDDTTPKEEQHNNNDSRPRLHMVISHCDSTVDWIWQTYLPSLQKDIQLASATILTKCGKPLGSVSFQGHFTLQPLPNVGRCDHSYAYWIQQHLAKIPDDDFILFSKDHDNSYRVGQWEVRVNFTQMMRHVHDRGFACASRLNARAGGKFVEPQELANNYLNTQELGNFRLGKYTRQGVKGAKKNDTFVSPHAPLKKWLQHVGINDKLPPIVPVCFGGVFLTTGRQLKASAKIANWTALVQSLERDDNIEEGHYMERLWAALLSQPTPQETLDIFQKPNATRVITIKEFRSMIVLRDKLYCGKPSCPQPL